MQLVEHFQLFANSPELKSAERKERYKQVLGVIDHTMDPTDANLKQH